MIQRDAHVYSPRAEAPAVLDLRRLQLHRYQKSPKATCFGVAKKAGNSYLIFVGPKEKFSARRARAQRGAPTEQPSRKVTIGDA